MYLNNYNMYVIFLIILFTQTILAWDCREYVRNFPEGKGIIPKNDRHHYITKVCLAISMCHAKPILYSVEAYSDDIIQCYKTRNFNFDINIFEYNNDVIESYIQARVEKSSANSAYDSVNLHAKDTISNILDIVRLREAYLREYQYTQSRDFSGDILMLLRHDQRSFSSNSNRQMSYIKTYIDTSREQLEKIEKIEKDVQIAYEQIINASNTLDSKQVEFNDFQQRIQENVIESLLVIEY